MKERYVLLYSIRGITLLSMILYHGMFDLVEIYGLHVPWFGDRPGYVWQQSICWIFILLSGFCWNLGKRHLKRGLVISAWGLLITGVTYAFMPIGKDTVWNPDFYRNGYAASDPAVKSVGTDSIMDGIRRKLPAFWTDKKCEQRNLGL